MFNMPSISRIWCRAFVRARSLTNKGVMTFAPEFISSTYLSESVVTFKARLGKSCCGFFIRAVMSLIVICSSDQVWLFIIPDLDSRLSGLPSINLTLIGGITKRKWEKLSTTTCK